MSGSTTRAKAAACHVFTALLLVASPRCATAADFAPFKGLPTNQASKRDAGSCRVLAGKVVLVNIFVSDAESDWSRPERREVRRRTRAALKFVGREAARYDQELEFEQIRIAVDYPHAVPTRLASDPAWTQQVIQAAAGEMPNELCERLRQRADHVLIALHVNKSARSYNLAYYESVDRGYHAERIVCFTRYEDDRPTAAGSYVHELLHAFGAGELYFPYDEADSRRKLAAQLFPRDIMRQVEYDMDDLEIGRYTAYRVGWTNTLPNRYRVFQDPD